LKTIIQALSVTCLVARAAVIAQSDQRLTIQAQNEEIDRRPHFQE
jgi:hypothetical protein